MDRSLDSIGSCSLDVEADSSVSDTTSLNFPTPNSAKDITQEFTANIRERCSGHATDVNSQVCTVVTQPIGGTATSAAVPTATIILSTETKPSYLNLACCVNGYSKLTSYDSKIRQDINKSREVSPIRPSANSIAYCKKSDCLAPPVLLKMSHNDGSKMAENFEGYHYYTMESNNNKSHENGKGLDCTPEKDRGTSFIQQRVERLYGPGALAQSFYSPRKVRCAQLTNSEQNNGGPDVKPTSELLLKFKQLSPGNFKKNSNGVHTNPHTTPEISTKYSENNSIDLPVLRHLSQEFRAQLPTISPKRNLLNSNSLDYTTKTTTNVPNPQLLQDEVDNRKVFIEQNAVVLPLIDAPNGYQRKADSNEHILHNKSTSLKIAEVQSKIDMPPSNQLPIIDGNHFLQLLWSEQVRLLALADTAEKYLDALSGNSEVTDDVLGLLRSASGKSRLLVSQKMKQFEGLCYKNLNGSPEDKFPTTVDDLQGFWDMVNLQVDHINSIFAEVEAVRNNEWKKTKVEAPTDNATKQKTKPVNVKSRSSSKLQASSANSAATQKRESQRQLLLDMKRKNRKAMHANSSNGAVNVALNDGSTNAIEIFCSDNNG